MWEYWQSWTGYWEDTSNYVVTSAGEVYDASTGAIVGWYDETTDTVYDAAGETVEAIKNAGVKVYDDLKAGLEDIAELPEKVLETIDRTRDTADKAIDAVTVITFTIVAAAAYWLLGGKLK